MPVSFLDLVPKRPTATVTIDTEDGLAQFEVTGVPLSQLAEIGRRFPAFARVIEGGAGLLSATEAMPALVAAGLGHNGDAAYERQAANLPSGVMMHIAGEIVRLTFLQSPPTEPGEAEPAPEEAAASATRPGRISPLRLSS